MCGFLFACQMLMLIIKCNVHLSDSGRVAHILISKVLAID